MRVLIAFNAPQASLDPHGRGTLAYQGVLTEVEDVAWALRRLGHTVDILAVGLDPRGELARLSQAHVDLVFNLVESIGGKDYSETCFAAILQWLDLPFTGAGPEALALTCNKNIAHGILTAHGIPTPRSWTGWDVPDPVEFPLIIKPACEDGSIGIDGSSVVHDWQQLKKGLRGDQELIVQEYLPGEEATIALMGHEQPQFLPTGRIDYGGMPSGHPPILSYRAKWVPTSPEYLGSTPYWDDELLEEDKPLREAARRVFHLFRLQGYSRVDFRADTQGNFHVIDINPNPDISRTAGFARSAQAMGWPYEELIQMIVDLALESFAARKKAI